jgi:putative ABC transport system substrate-binding protein
MERRRFVHGVALGAGLLVAPCTASQQASRIYRIGVLGNQKSPAWEAFVQGLRDLGYTDGRNIAIEWRWSEGFPERHRVLAEQLVALKPDVIIAGGSQATRAAMQLTSTIPIVMATVAYPDRQGLVKGLSRPGGNVTGLSNLGPELHGKLLELLREVAPPAARMAVLWNPENVVEQLSVEELRAAAGVFGVTIESAEARSPDDLKAAFTRIASSGVDALLALANPVNIASRQLITDFALSHRLPSIYQEKLFIQAGGLISYGPSFNDLLRRAAIYVDRILKGAKPAELPVEQPTRFELGVNLKTAKALGLTIPPQVLLRADQVID